MSAAGHSENTRDSFLEASQQGAAWVELDVLPTKDGDLILHHSHFSSGRPVWEQTTRELQEQGLQVLSEGVRDLPVEVGVNVELKAVPGDLGTSGSCFVDQVAAWTLEEQEQRPVLVTSFDPAVATHLNERGLAVGWAVRQGWPLFEAVSVCASLQLRVAVVHGPTTLSLADREILAYGLQVAREQRIEVAAWDTELEDLAELTRLGVYAHCVDDVPGGVQKLATLGQIPTQRREGANIPS